MPDSFQKFFIAEGYTEEQLKTDADLPDMVDKDNITQDAEIHHAHSFKMQEVEGRLKWLDGDVLERLKGLSADAHDFHAEGRSDMVRYCLAKMTHYRCDSLTYPHLHRGKPWSEHHAPFETELGGFIVKHQDEIGKLEFKPYDDVYKSCRRTAETMWHEGLEVITALEKGEKLTDEQKLHICRICVQGIGDLWLTLAKELKL